MDRGFRAMEGKTAMATAAPEFSEEQFFEYHLYGLEQPTTIGDNESRQLRFLSAAQVPVTRQLTLTAMPQFFRGPQTQPVPPQHAAVPKP